MAPPPSFAAPGDVPDAADRSGVVIRHLDGQADYRACVALQYETWGRQFNDAVPPSILLVAQKLGGVAAGAFDQTGRLLGFVFGITGVENGRVVHWSDMLAVRPEARNAGIARRLKDFQRRAVAHVGGKVIYWTFDPLVARNAYLNFNVFGVRVVRYVRDMYGSDTGSELHRGIGTDRLVLAWPVADDELAARRAEIARHSASADTHGPMLGDPQREHPTRVVEDSQRLRIAVPADLQALLEASPADAVRWRTTTRAAFERALGAGFEVHGFAKGATGGWYLLAKS